MPLRAPTLLLALAFIGLGACSKTDPGETKAPVAPTADVTIKGIDYAMLTTREKRDWTGQLGELLSPCAEVPVNLLQCIQEQRPCKACLPAAQFLLKQVQAGRPKKEREEAFHARFDTGKIKTLVTDGSPEMGSPDAPVTIVEWADFECPFCKLVSPIVDDIVHRFPDQVRLVYKFYPLNAHPHGEIAARAAFAALQQGKFWEMHHMLFENQEHLEPADLEHYAKQLNLDAAKFRADASPGGKEASERIDKDKKQADGLGLDGTPFMFINGRLVKLELLANPYDDLVDWVRLDIELSGHTPKEVGSGAPSAGPAPKAPPPASAAPAAAGSASAGKK